MLRSVRPSVCPSVCLSVCLSVYVPFSILPHSLDGDIQCTRRRFKRIPSGAAPEYPNAISVEAYRFTARYLFNKLDR